MKYLIVALLLTLLLPIQVSAASVSGWIFVNEDPRSSYQKYCGPSYNREVVQEKTVNGKRYQKIKCVQKQSGNGISDRNNNGIVSWGGIGGPVVRPTNTISRCTDFLFPNLSYIEYKQAKVRDRKMPFTEYKVLSNKFFGINGVSTDENGHNKINYDGIMLLNNKESFMQNKRCISTCWDGKIVNYSTKRIGGKQYYFLNIAESRRCK